MKQFYLVLIVVSAAFMAKAQIPIPPAPASGNSTSCTTNPNIDVCPPTSNTVVGSHRNGTYHHGNSSNHLDEGAVWRFRNMATVGNVVINVEVTIDEISNATLDNIDDDDAVDEGGVSIRNFFAPRIRPDQNLTSSNRRGYVQFSMKFFKNNNGFNNNTDADFAIPVSLSNLNYVHYDIDGGNANNTNSGTVGSWFRETGMAKKISANNPMVLANSVSELSSYNYTDGGANWTGFAGTIFERDGVSRCAQVASSFSYDGSQPGISVRMGYDYNAGSNGGRPVRQYGSRLGCFNFPSLSTLPVDLMSFSASYSNDQAYLKWTSDHEVNFEKFIVERSHAGVDFVAIAEKMASGNSARNSYELSDDLSAINGSIFYYRLKMLDKDGRFTYSSIVMVKKDAKAINGIAINPNPVSSSSTTVRFTSSRSSTVELKVVDITGKVLLQQMNKVAEGNNSVSINNLERLKPGLYILQMIHEGESSVVKFSVAR